MRGQGPSSSDPHFPGWESKTDTIARDIPVPTSDRTDRSTTKGNSDKGCELFAPVEEREKSASSPETRWLSGSVPAAVSEASPSLPPSEPLSTTSRCHGFSIPSGLY